MYIKVQKYFFKNFSQNFSSGVKKLRMLRLLRKLRKLRKIWKNKNICIFDKNVIFGLFHILYNILIYSFLFVSLSRVDLLRRCGTPSWVVGTLRPTLLYNKVEQPYTSLLKLYKGDVGAFILTRRLVTSSVRVRRECLV